MPSETAEGASARAASLEARRSRFALFRSCFAWFLISRSARRFSLAWNEVGGGIVINEWERTRQHKWRNRQTGDVGVALASVMCTTTSSPKGYGRYQGARALETVE